MTLFGTPESEVINPTEICYRAFELMQGKQYDEAEKLLTGSLSKSDDDVAIALFHSSLGVLFKLKGEYKVAWRHYERAEKLLPKDPALKLISARLLLEQFAEYDQAIKKAKKIFDIIPENPVFVHQACIIIGLCHFKKSHKKKAIEMLKKSIIEDFKGFVTTKNIDFNLVEALVRKGWAKAECEEFINKAYLFAKERKEEAWIEILEKMISVFPKEASKEDGEREDE
jgi:tetratricopeptide (TPR) repeat protein